MPTIEDPKWENTVSYAEIEDRQCNSPTSNPMNNSPRIEIIKEKPLMVETLIKNHKDEIKFAHKCIAKTIFIILCIAIGLFIALYFLIHTFI